MSSWALSWLYYHLISEALLLVGVQRRSGGLPKRRITSPGQLGYHTTHTRILKRDVPAISIPTSEMTTHGSQTTVLPESRTSRKAMWDQG